MAGTLLAILMSRRGYEIDLFEQHADPHSGDRQIDLASNLALGERARHALRVTGLLEQVDRLSTPMRGRMIHDRSGRLTLQPYGYNDYETLYSVRRESLQQCLLYEARHSERIRIHYDHRLHEIDWDNNTARVYYAPQRGRSQPPFRSPDRRRWPRLEGQAPDGTGLRVGRRGRHARLRLQVPEHSGR